MVTFCTQAACEYILKKAPLKPLQWFIEANMSGDKKATMQSLIQTRGKKVVSEVILPARLVRKALRTTAQTMAEYWRMSFTGGAQTGSVGVGGHMANGLAAIFLACGQDIACVAEAATGVTRMEKTKKGELHVTVTLPNLIVGTVGGGTGLPTARECLNILGCTGEGSARKLAEICAALVLAGEISMIGAICAGEFVNAHQSFGRSVAPGTL